MAKKIIITRHKALVLFLEEQGICGELIEHATEEEVKGKDVYGILPLHLAACAKSITTIDLDIPLEKRGVELSLDDIKRFYKGMHTYEVKLCK